MNVELPDGCNIINSSTTFYNYTNNNRTRAIYYIYDGKAFKSTETTNVNPYTYTGTCLVTGDLVYKPEVKVYFPFLAAIIISLILFIIYHIMLRRFLR